MFAGGESLALGGMLGYIYGFVVVEKFERRKLVGGG